MVRHNLNCPWYALSIYFYPVDLFIPYISTIPHHVRVPLSVCCNLRTPVISISIIRMCRYLLHCPEYTLSIHFHPVDLIVKYATASPGNIGISLGINSNLGIVILIPIIVRVYRYLLHYAWCALSIHFYPVDLIVISIIAPPYNVGIP